MYFIVKYFKVTLLRQLHIWLSRLILLCYFNYTTLVGCCLYCSVFVNSIVQKVMGGFFCEIWGIGRLWTREELIFY